MQADFANIANPIYDGVFKYLLDDNRIAKLFLSALIGSEITELSFRPTEIRSDLAKHSITIFRIDFAATLRTEDGRDKMVLIEIQKAKLAEDILRFRRYLGSQYSSPDNFVLREHPPESKVPLEIFTIYFLGHKLDHTEEPVVWVRRGLYGAGGNPQQAIEGMREEFIDALTHDSIVVQIPYLKKRRRTELEKLLAVFDQSQKLTDDGHILGLSVADYPEKYHGVIRRLTKAAADQSVREEMGVEDNFLQDMQERERVTALQIGKLEQKAEEERRKKEEALRLAEEERRQKEEERRQKEEERRQKEEERRQKEEERRQKEEERRQKEEALREKEELRKQLAALRQQQAE